MLHENSQSIKELRFPVKSIIQKDAIGLLLQDGSYLEMQNYNRELEFNIASSFGYNTKRPIYYFDSLVAKTKNEGRGSFLLGLANYILDKHDYWAFNEVRPKTFTQENLDSLIRLYQRYGYRLLQKGKDCALMLRVPNQGQMTSHFPKSCMRN